MKRKAYIQPELDLFNILSAEDILAGSVDGEIGDGDWDGASSGDHNDDWGWN